MDTAREVEITIATLVNARLEAIETQIIQIEKINGVWNALAEVWRDIDNQGNNSRAIKMCFYSVKWNPRTSKIRFERLTEYEIINALISTHHE
jgi:hypothetical protein